MNQIITAIPSRKPEKASREADFLVRPLTKKMVPRRIGMSKTVNSRGVVVVNGRGYSVKSAKASRGLKDFALCCRNILKSQ